MCDFDYVIYCNGVIVAQFRVETDRDYALDALQEVYPDAEWSK